MGMPLLFLCAALLLSCAKQPVLPAHDQTGAETVQTDRTDGEILRIAEEARRTLPVFFRHLTRAEAGEEGFSIKYPFKADEGAGIVMEQLWLTGIHFKDGNYYGTVAGDPVYISGMKKGDTAVFDEEMITDWMYIRNGKISGGRSIKYLIETIPESRRSEGQRKMLEMFDD